MGIIDIISIMTLYHKVISRTTGEWTGEMRQCSSDPCPVHPTRNHFRADSAKEAELMALERRHELIKQIIHRRISPWLDLMLITILMILLVILILLSIDPMLDFLYSI